MTQSDEREHTSPPYPPRVARRARDEMEYADYETQFGQSMPVSVPTQLRFTGPASQDTERFHDALGDVGFAATRCQTESGDRGEPYYDGEVCTTETYKRIRVLVFRGGVVRIYPREDEPTFAEVYRLLDAIRRGFDAPLEHHPIDGEGEQ